MYFTNNNLASRGARFYIDEEAFNFGSVSFEEIERISEEERLVKKHNKPFYNWIYFDQPIYKLAKFVIIISNNLQKSQKTTTIFMILLNFEVIKRTTEKEKQIIKNS